MTDQFNPIAQGVLALTNEWAPKLTGLTNEVISERKNKQNRSIKQILGHMIDSASNNTHRIIHMQYQPSPLIYPNYASKGNNDRWITIQNYQEEDWKTIVNLWKYSNLHFVHVIQQVNPEKLENTWQASENTHVSLRDCVVDYLRHFRLHLDEIQELINRNQ